MSDAANSQQPWGQATFDENDVWQPPQTFRDTVADTETAAQQLLDALAAEPSMFVTVDQLEFLARRLHRLARHTHRSLPPEVG